MVANQSSPPGGVELIYCDQDKVEAFINPVIQQFFKAGPTDKAAINIPTELQQKNGILCCFARRKSREEDEPALKHAHANAHNTYGNAQFKMTYFVRFCGQTRNTIQQRRFALETLSPRHIPSPRARTTPRMPPSPSLQH